MRVVARVLTILGLLLGFVGIARAQTYELKVSTYLPPSQTLSIVLNEWAQEVDKHSNGRLTIRIYPASQLGPVQRQFDLARNGQADIALGLTGATPGRYPMTELASLPFTWPNNAITSEVASRRLTELAPQYLEPEFKGLHILWVGRTPLNTIFTSRREIAAISDIQGLKIRFQGEQHAKMLRVLGAAPLQVPPSEIADGLAKGVIDGAVFSYEAAESFGIASATQHVMEPPFAGATLVLVMNKAKYEALPGDLRTVIDETTGPEAAQRLGIRWDQAEEHGRQVLISAKVGINTLPPPELEKLKAALRPITAEAVDALEKDGKPATQFLADYTR